MSAQTAHRSRRRRFRSLFVSDIHLGCRHAQADRFLKFLDSVQPEQLYLVGDVIDGWRLSRRWYWEPGYVKILQRIMQLAMNGTQVYYTPGNHDEFLRNYLHDFGLITVADQFIHTTADGRRFVVLHGDQFDNVERGAKWLSIAGAYAYDWLVWANEAVNRVRRLMGLVDCRFSRHVKIWAKQAVQYISDFEERLVCHAKELECDGVICGHIHVPRIEDWGEIVYCNSGDWVEHCSALIEHDTGEFEIIDCFSDATASSIRERQTSSMTALDDQVAPAELIGAMNVPGQPDELRLGNHYSQLEEILR